MINISEDARLELAAYFEGKELEPLRIYLTLGGCSGPKLALTLGQATSDDILLEKNGYTFCVSKDILDKAKKLFIDINHTGFFVRAEQSLGQSGCATCPSTCKAD